MYDNRSGNALIMILIAVSLFGALSYAFMQGSRSSTSMLTDEAAKAYAQQIIAYGDGVKMAFKRLELRGNATDQINLFTPVYKRGDGSALISSNPKSTSEAQNVFSSAGGGVQPFIVPRAAMSKRVRLPLNSDYGHYYFRSVEVMGSKTTANDVVMVLEGVSQQVCKKIHEILNVNGGEQATADSTSGQTGGIYTYTGTGILGDQAAYIVGKKAFCVGDPASDYLAYMNVIVDR